MEKHGVTALEGPDTCQVVFFEPSQHLHNWPSRLKPSGSISLLPPELFHAIFELLALLDHNTLSSCMRVCRRWHDIARLYFFAIVPSHSHGCRRLSKLLSADPRLAAYVKHVRFTWATADSKCRARVSPAPSDVGSLESVIPVLGLTNLQYLSIAGYNDFTNPPLLRQLPAQRRSSPVRSLQRLSFDNCVGVTCILPELLSLFSVRTLVIRIDTLPSQRSPSPIHPSIPLASFAIRDLVLDTAPDVEEYYRFFELMLAPGSLRALCITVWNSQAFPRAGQLLRSGVAQDLRSISIHTVLPDHEYEQSGFPALGAALAHCTRLECFRIVFKYFWNEWLWDALCRRETFEPVIANLPSTLRAFAIHTGKFAGQSWKRFCAGAVSLDVVDRLLSPAGGRFPHLQRAELHMLYEVGLYGKPIKKLRPSPLPRLEAVGLLQVNVQNLHDVERHGIRVPNTTCDTVDMYLPPEVQ